MPATLSVFLSYVDLDAGAANQLKLIFGTLRNDFRIDLTTQQPLPNDSATDPNLSALAECDLAVVLMSKAYARTEYMRRRMLPAILARMEAGDCFVLPIYLEATERDASPLVGTPIAKIPPRPLNTYTDPKQGYLVIENSLRKFLAAQGYSRFASTGPSLQLIIALCLIGLLGVAGWIFWRERGRSVPAPSPPVARSQVFPALGDQHEEFNARQRPSPRQPSGSCPLPPIFSRATSCTKLLPASGNYRGCKHRRIFYVLTPDCDTLRLRIPVEQHHKIYKMESFDDGRAPVYFRTGDSLYVAFWVDTSGNSI